MDREAWRATIHGVAMNQTRLSAHALTHTHNFVNHLGFPIPTLEKNLFAIRYFVWVPFPKKNIAHGRIRNLLMFVNEYSFCHCRHHQCSPGLELHL